MMFPKRLKELRNKKKLTQQDMADFLGISRQGYGKYEDGKSEPDHNTLVKLANYFGVTTDYLLGHDLEVNDDDKRKAAIIEKIKTEFPDADLMFNDLASFTADDMQDVYDYIKFKKSQKNKGD